MQLSFKTLPTNQAVTALALGKGKGQKGKVFVVEGNVVRGMTKKGKEFFSFDTNITEKIEKIAVCETQVWASGEYTHSTFQDSKEKHFFISPDRINDSDIVPISSIGSEYVSVLACQDRVVRVLDGSKVSLEFALGYEVPTCIRYIHDSHDPLNRHPGGKELIYGTESGVVGQIFLDSESISAGFTIENPAKLGAVTAVFSGIDFTRDGINDIVVGRDDGHVEIYGFDELGGLHQVFRTHLSQAINGLEGGYITSSTMQDLVVHTFSGKVIALSLPGAGLFQSSPPPPKPQTKQKDEEDARKEFASKINKMQEEVQLLASRLQESKCATVSIL